METASTNTLSPARPATTYTYAERQKLLSNGDAWINVEGMLIHGQPDEDTFASVLPRYEHRSDVCHANAAAMQAALEVAQLLQKLKKHRSATKMRTGAPKWRS